MSWQTAILLCVLVQHVSSRSTEFPPGWNGLAEKPPMGWRSWNAFGNRGCTQDNMKKTIDALTAPIWTINGKHNVSLQSVGYSAFGIDEGWEGCGKGVNGTQHDAKGNPVINTDRFPDMKGLVDYGHSKGLKMGWYENGCACGERHALERNYEGDVSTLHELGFDGVKLDGCGAQRNMTEYAALMKATGKAYLIENCHWGRCTGSDDSSCPTADWCPFNWYRTSGDINNSPMSWLGNLQTTIRFQDPKAPLSRPGCWAYPDMLEVGRIAVNGKIDYGWNRAHFGAWCVVSAPLILGLDLTQQAPLSLMLDVITNSEALAVSQAWAGHPGALIYTAGANVLGYPAARKCDPSNKALHQHGWTLGEFNDDTYLVQAPGGGCLEQKGHGYPGGAGGLVVANCDAANKNQIFTFKKPGEPGHLTLNGHCVDVHSGGPIVWMYGCTSGPNDEISFKGELFKAAGKCIGVEAEDPAGSTFQNTLQAWAKPLEGSDGVAVLLINPGTKQHAFKVPLKSIPLTGDGHNLASGAINVRNIWTHKDEASLPASATHLTMKVGGMDSVFLRLSKK